MGFLGRGMGAGIGAGLNQASRSYLDATMWGRERDEQEKQRQALLELARQRQNIDNFNAVEMQRERQARAQAEADELARQQRVETAISGLMQPTPIGVPGGTVEQAYPDIDYRKVAAIPGVKPKEWMPFYKANKDEDAIRLRNDLIMERLGMKNRYRMEEQEQAIEGRKAVKATPAGATTHIARKEGGGGAGSKKGRKPAVVDSERANAEAAIAAGRDPIKVKALYQMRTGKRW